MRLGMQYDSGGGRARSEERALWNTPVRTTYVSGGGHCRCARAEGRSQMGERESRGAELGTFGSEFSGTSKL